MSASEKEMTRGNLEVKEPGESTRRTAESRSALSAERVSAIFDACLTDQADEDEIVEVEAIHEKSVARFKKEALNQYEAEIRSMLDELPDNFRADGGGGWSFLQASFNKHGRQWADHPITQQLLLLGIAVGKVTYLDPNREMWQLFEAGMPYYVIH